MKRFWSKVDKTSSCWIWLGEKDRRGYGRFRIDGKRVPAHRVSWMLSGRPEPSVGWYGPANLNGMSLDHDDRQNGCGNPSCVNPSHLSLATQKRQKENLRGPQRNSTSGRRGVYWSQRHKKWRVKVQHDGRAYSGPAIGKPTYYSSIDEAELIANQLRSFLFQ